VGDQRRAPLAALATALLLPFAIYLSMWLYPSIDMEHQSALGHFYSVLPVAVLASVVAVAMGVSANRLRNIQVTCLSLAFGSLAPLFLLHGLATPGLFMPASAIPGVAGQSAFLLTALWLLLSALPSDHPLLLRLGRVQVWLVPVWMTLMGVVVVAGMLSPELVESLMLWTLQLKFYAVLTTLLFLGAAGYRYWQAYRYAHMPLQIALVCGAGWIVAAQVILATSQSYRLSWWFYHLLLVAAMVVVVVGLVRQFSYGSSLTLALRGLFTADPLERVQAGISPSVRALVIATETHDSYTAGHSFRVAMIALRLGEAMNLPPEQLRALAQGGILHDVGKIEVPNAILNKPGPLTTPEREAIERHPATGYHMCKQLGFLQTELEVIRSHHERWDGRGYPDRLKGEEIPLHARILSVADVYDALTSHRSYRPAMSHIEASQLITTNAGAQFDPAVVEAWQKLAAQGSLTEVPEPDWTEQRELELSI
jgi:putative nucleotidyltransferase with HDIG domain